MRHLKQRSVVMAASTALILAVGAFSLPQTRGEAAPEQRTAGAFSWDLASVFDTTSTTSTTTSTAPSTTAAPTTVAPTTLPPTTVAPPTTAAPVTTLPPPPPPQPVVQAASGACGGDLPSCCIMMRESRGNPTVVNPSSGASGKWQFMYTTWNHYMGYETAAQAPEWVQDARARELWAGGAGASHWAGSGC